MKQQISAALKAFLLANGPSTVGGSTTAASVDVVTDVDILSDTDTLTTQTTIVTVPGQFTIADLLTITLVNGAVYRFTSWDYDVWLGGNKFSAMGTRFKRGRIQNQRGVETSLLKITLMPDNSPDLSGGSLSSTVPPQNIGVLSLTQALVAGILIGSQVRLETIYNPTRQQDGSYIDSGMGSIIKFIGVLADAQSTRASMQMNVASLLHTLAPMWPPYVFQPQCRWRLFDAGCKLNADNFAVNGTVTQASTQSTIYHGLTNPSGYFTGGRLVFTTGQNVGISRQIKTALGEGSAASYAGVIANDKPSLWLRLNDAAGSGTAADSSGNGYNATVYGGITFGQPSLLVGDAGTGARFDGSSGYLTCPIPKPANSAAGITFEFWYNLSPSAGAEQPTGIFDTHPHTSTTIKIPSLVNGYGPKDFPPQFQWYNDQPAIGFDQPALGSAVHVVVVYFGAQSMSVYFNGLLYQTASNNGNGGIGWNSPIRIGTMSLPRTGTKFFDGTLQHFAIYAYSMSSNQVLTHYTAGITAPLAGSNIGTFNMLHPFPYVPNVGDAFTAWPGCDKSTTVCSGTFQNLANFAGEPFQPQPDQSV